MSENQTGISYRKLFGSYIRGAHRVEIVDPYIRKMYQIRNFVEFLQVVLEEREEGEETVVHLITDYDEFSRVELEGHLNQIQDNLINQDIDFSYEFDNSHTIHARSITTDTGWKISLDRGLDIFQRFDTGLLAIQSASQEARYCKSFEVTYLRVEQNGRSG